MSLSTINNTGACHTRHLRVDVLDLHMATNNIMHWIKLHMKRRIFQLSYRQLGLNFNFKRSCLKQVTSLSNWRWETQICCCRWKMYLKQSREIMIYLLFGVWLTPVLKWRRHQMYVVVTVYYRYLTILYRNLGVACRDLIQGFLSVDHLTRMLPSW